MRFLLLKELPKGEPKIIVTGLEAYGFSFTRDNKKIVYTKNLNYSNLWELAFKKVEKSSQTIKLTNSTITIKYPVISPDKKAIAFVKSGNVYIKQIDKDKIEQITFFNEDCYRPSWSPDGKQIAIYSDSKLILISTQGEVKKIFKNIAIGGQLCWNTDSTILCFNSGNFNLYVFNIITGEQKTFIKSENYEWMYNPIFSPEMKKVAIHWNKNNYGIWIISLEDSSQKFLIKGRLLPLKWTEDGRYIFIFDYVKSEILKVFLNNGSIAEHLKIPFNGINALNNDIDITADGKIIVCAVPGIKLRCMDDRKF